MTTWFSSDTHFGHLNIISYTNRPYHSVPEMNAALVNNWNSVVQPDDTVWFLGDFAMGKIDETLPIALQLNGDKHLVPGNHDRCWYYHRKKVEEWVAKYEEVGLSVHHDKVAFEGDVLLCHFPYEGDSQNQDRYEMARPEDKGKALLHGHTHASQAFTRSSKGTPMLNVGVDAWGQTPVSLETLLGLL